MGNRKHFILRILSVKVSFTIFMFVALFLVFAILTPGNIFLSSSNLSSLARLAPDLGVIAIPIGMLMICGEFDVSVPSIIAMSSFVFVNLLGWGVPLAIAPFLTLLVGGLMGLMNGLLVVKTRIPSFIATLGTQLFWKGILFGISQMMPIGIRSSLPEGSFFESMLVGKIGGLIPVQILWLIGITLVFWALVHRHRFGNWIFTTGDNSTAARAMGIDTDKVKTACYVMVGVVCSFMAMMQALRIESFAATQGVGMDLRAIASCVVGGVALTGGIGSILGVFFGTLTIQIIENGLILMGAPVFGINAFIGAAVILFVIINVGIERLSLYAQAAASSPAVSPPRKRKRNE
ncbi:MAG: ABC transporter permease [Rectinemataceae bacterium]